MIVTRRHRCFVSREVLEKSSLKTPLQVLPISPDWVSVEEVVEFAERVPGTFSAEYDVIERVDD